MVQCPTIHVLWSAVCCKNLVKSSLVLAIRWMISFSISVVFVIKYCHSNELYNYWSWCRVIKVTSLFAVVVMIKAQAVAVLRKAQVAAELSCRKLKQQRHCNVSAMGNHL